MSTPRGFLSLAAPAPNWTDLIEAAGIKAKYDPETGMVTFDGGSFRPDDQWALWFEQRAAKSDVQQEAYTYSPDTGVADAYVVVLRTIPIIVPGSEVVFKAANANTGPSTLTVNREAAVALTKNGGTVALAAGDIAEGQIITAKYDGTVWQVTVGSVGPGSGTVTSVALTVPTGLTVAGSPITVSGTLAISENTQAANKVKAGPATGAAAVPAYRSLVAADIPVLLILKTDGTPNGLQSLLNLIAGTNVTLTDDGVGGITIDAAGIGGGTVTSVALTLPSWLTVAGSPVTTAGTLAVTAATGQAANLFLATPDGTTGAVTLRAIVAGDFLSVPFYVGCALVGIPTVGQTVLLAALPINGQFAANFTGSVGSLGTNPTATAVYTVKNGATTIGTVSISTGGAFTFATTAGAVQSFSANDRLTIIAPSPADATLSDATITLKATRT